MRSLSVAASELGWRRAAAIGLANVVQVVLTGWILRRAAITTRPQSVRVGVLQVAALIAANALQAGLIWWLYRGKLGQRRHPDDSAAPQLNGGQ